MSEKPVNPIQRTLDPIGRMAGAVPCCEIRFDQSGQIVGELRKLV
ncbi:MAG: hypothetical protein NTU59_10630 [Coprothermobacterota bacterium]|nr:hypothetical protein [Coprothermobacterota bacterium]